MRILRYPAMLLAAVAYFGGSAAAGPITESVPGAQGEVRWSDGVLRATGTGVRPRDAESAAQARLLARTAALADAYRNLAQVINEVRVTASTTVERFLATDDTIRMSVEAYIRGAVVVAESDDEDGSYRVTIQVPLTGKNALTGLVLPNVLRTPRVSAPVEIATHPGVVPSDPRTSPPLVSMPTPPMPSVPQGPAALNLEPELLTPAGDQGPFTGVIIDARGLHMQPAMSPRLFDALGKEIYGTVNVDASFAEEVGIAGYMGTIRAAMALERVGKRPLVIRAIGTPDQFRRYATISAEDAQRLLAANAQTRFLEKCAVAFIVDERRARDEGR
jgi:hypothetical protein